ncbi:MAG: DUF6504 family protein [Chloroflexaceae bacterium]|nr:DUF6504 family protein [Chloroflexaceae bacterium]
MNTPVIVHCRAEASYPGRPLRFTWNDETHMVEAVLREWREPAAHCFLLACGGGVAELAYMPAEELWVLRQFSPIP